MAAHKKIKEEDVISIFISLKFMCRLYVTVEEVEDARRSSNSQEPRKALYRNKAD